MTEDSNALADELDARLANADAALAAAYPGDRGRRQPVHTVYVPADRYDSGTVRGWAEEAKRALAAHGRSTTELAEANRTCRPSVAVEVYERLRRKLDSEAVEDLRIDFEDGYGIRPDDDEDAAAVAAAQCLAASIAAGDAAPFHGIRVKSFEAPTRRRGVRTLQLFMRTLVEAGGLTDGFVVTLPKVTSVDQVEAFVFALGRVEEACSLEPGALQLRDPGRDTAGDPRRRRHGAGFAHDPRRRRPRHRPALRHLRLLRVARRRGRVPEPGASGRRPRQGGHAGGGRRYRCVRVATGRRTCFPSATATRCARRGGCTPAWSGGRWSAASTRAGTCTRPSCPSRYVATYSFFREGLRRAAERLPRVRARRTVRLSSTNRRRPRRWPDSCSAASSAAPSTRQSSTSWSGWTRMRWPHSRSRRPKA